MFSHVQLFATPWTVACQAPLSMGFSRQEEWSRWGSSWPRDQTQVPRITGRFFTTQATREALVVEWAQIPCTDTFILPTSLSSLIFHGAFPTLWIPARPISAVHNHHQVCVISPPLSMGILQARILEWVAYPFSRGTSQPRNHLEYLFLISPHTQTLPITQVPA